MELKIFSSTQKSLVYVVNTSKNTKGDLTLFIHNRSTGIKQKIDERQLKEIKLFFKEIFKLNPEQFKKIVKLLNPKYEAYAYAMKLLEKKVEACIDRINFEENNIKLLEGQNGERIRLQLRLAEIMIREAQDEIEKLMEPE